jgi:K+-transporting ATPase KdpF subunit
MNQTTLYIIGALIALFIMGYLIYSLIKPEKF